MIYLLHSTVALGTTGRNSGCHYLGYCHEGELWTRMHAHHTGKSKVSIVRAYLEAGASLYLVRVWPDGGQSLERHLKNRGHYRSHCPICQGLLAPKQAVSIEVASTLTMTPAVLRSRKQMNEAKRSAPSGTDASKPGSLVQLVIQVPNAWSGSDAGATLAIPGGHASHVAAPTKPPAVKSAGTRQPLSGSGKTTESGSTPANRERRHSDQPGPTPRQMMLEIGTSDEEEHQA